MATIRIDNKEYDTDDLSEDALANLKSIQFVDAEILRLQAKLSAMSTAKNAYSSALAQLLPDTTAEPVDE